MVADAYPWPPTTGMHLRLLNTIKALTELGETDLFCLYDARQPQDPIPSELGISRVCMVPFGPVHETPVRRAVSLARRDLPLEVALRDGDKRPREVFDSWRAPSYDLAWFRSATLFQWLGRPSLGPTVVDVCDLADVKERQRAVRLSDRAVDGVSSRVRRSAAVAQARINSRDWRAFQRSAASEVARVVLANEADVALLAADNCEVVPNAYDKPDRPVGHLEPRRPPTLLFQGTFDYGPNIDGARWISHELGPVIRKYLPEARIRLVGTTTKGVEALADPPLLTVVGRVPRMEPELAGADVVVVPLRMGGGTRLKILEAFAHRVPVVSTRVGADGLAVEDGTHLLLADQPDDFARACARLCDDVRLRQKMVEAAQRLFEERYESRVAQTRVHDIVESLTHAADGSQSSSGPRRR